MGDNNERSRRKVLKNAGALAGTASFIPGAAAAETPEIVEEQMGGEAEKSFVGTVMSSPEFKAIRDALLADGFHPARGAAVGARLRNVERGESVERLHLPFEARGKSDGTFAEAVVVRTPHGTLQAVALLAEDAQFTEGGEWLKQYTSSPSALQETDSGYFTLGPAEGN